MGIKNLNRYFKKHCSSKAIRTISLDEVKYKTLVIDAYIYIYKYLGEDNLRKRMEDMVSLFKEKSIKPIFVFDGKPPLEKQAVLAMRRQLRNQAEVQYRQLLSRQYSTDVIEDITEKDSQLLQELRRKFVRVKPEHVFEIKDILKKNDVEFVEAPYEADTICVQYVKMKRAWACVSDDMDMFVYGCPRVIRSLTIEHGIGDLYVLPVILNELKLSLSQFRDICVLSGTDYNMDESICLFKIIRLFRDYRRLRVREPFYDWLKETTPYIRDYDNLKQIRNLFDK